MTAASRPLLVARSCNEISLLLQTDSKTEYDGVGMLTSLSVGVVSSVRYC